MIGVGLTGVCTNVLLRWLLASPPLPGDAPEQRSSATALLEDRGRSFFVNDVVVAETAWILRKKLKLNKAVVADTFERLLAASNVEVADEDVLRRAIARYLDGPADLADELIGQINLSAGCVTTLTFDKDAGGSAAFTLMQ
jgi:predicted nucleic-acid-binding protein